MSRISISSTDMSIQVPTPHSSTYYNFKMSFVSGRKLCCYFSFSKSDYSCFFIFDYEKYSYFYMNFRISSFSFHILKKSLWYFY